jgi:hypothetical protein
MLRALQHLDANEALASVRARREWNDDGPRTPRNGTTRPPARRRHPLRECVAVEPQFPYGIHNAAAAYASSVSTDVAAYEDLC